MNYRVIGAIIIVLLVFFVGSLSLGNEAKKSQLEDAKILGESLKNYFRLADHKCRAQVEDYVGLTLCTNTLAAELELVSDIEESDFKNAKPEDNETGYIILENRGRNSFKSSNFTLMKNWELVDEGCFITGSIDPGYTCRLEFNTTCKEGDVLEIRYGVIRAYLKTC